MLQQLNVAGDSCESTLRLSVQTMHVCVRVMLTKYSAVWRVPRRQSHRHSGL